ncbi:MAG: class B sortase, partial [Ruminococcus sp.]
SLAGSLFLDNRNSADFSDNYSLIYGHNMDEHLMFGDLALFKDKEFFKNNTDAVLITPEETKDLKVMAILQIPAGTEEIFNPTVWRDSLKGLDDFIRKNSIWYHSDMVDLISECPKFVEVVSLVTCSDGSTNDRTVLILIHEKPDGGVAGDETVPDDENSGDDSYSDDDNYNNDNSNDDDYDGNGNGNGRDDIGGNGSKQTGDTQNEKLWIYLIIGTVIFIISFETIERYIKKFRDTEN